MRFADNVTFGQKYGPAMSITDRAEADRWFVACVEHSIRTLGIGQIEAEALERSNLGYYAGYYDAETRARVEHLFNCAHPVFGAIADGSPTAAEAYQSGQVTGGIRT